MPRARERAAPGTRLSAQRHATARASPVHPSASRLPIGHVVLSAQGRSGRERILRRGTAHDKEACMADAPAAAPPAPTPAPPARPAPAPEPTVSQPAPLRELKGKVAYITAGSDGI